MLDLRLSRFLSSVLWGRAVRLKFTGFMPRPFYPKRKRPRYHYIVGWVCPTGSLEEDIFLFFLPGIESQFLGRPASNLLSWTCIDCAASAPTSLSCDWLWNNIVTCREGAWLLDGFFYTESIRLFKIHFNCYYSYFISYFLILNFQTSSGKSRCLVCPPPVDRRVWYACVQWSLCVQWLRY
jgi:hypothetical protein